MRVELQLRGVEGIIETLRSLPPEIVSKSGGPVKLALKKGANVIREEAARNLRAAIERGGSQSTGLLEKSLIVSRGKPPIGSKGERYLVRVKRKAYDQAKLTKKETRGNPKNRKRVTTLQTANLLEYGSAHQPATPWLRPAVQAKGQETINVIVSDLNRRIDLIVKKLAAQNKVK